MKTGKKVWSWLVIVIAVLVMITSIAGIFGTWWLHDTVTNVTLKAFTIVDTAVGVVDAGATRAGDLVQRGRNEIQQVEATIVAVGGNIEQNNPLLTALSNRINGRLTPAVEQVRTALTPVASVVQSVRALVDFINAIPFIRETPPAVENVEGALNRLDEVVADVRQINDTVRAAVEGKADRFTEESVDTLTGLTQRVDSRLAETQASVAGVQAEIKALQERLAARRAQLLRIYTLTAVGLTLFFLWVIYSEVVVIRHRWRGLRKQDGEASEPAGALAPPSEQEVSTTDGMP